ncbi:hypothetical protein T310_9965, partial [Rasamsonia emersonii CBS 393.64]
GTYFSDSIQLSHNRSARLLPIIVCQIMLMLVLVRERMPPSLCVSTEIDFILRSTQGRFYRYSSWVPPFCFDHLGVTKPRREFMIHRRHSSPAGYFKETLYCRHVELVLFKP